MIDALASLAIGVLAGLVIYRVAYHHGYRNGKA